MEMVLKCQTALSIPFFKRLLEESETSPIGNTTAILEFTGNGFILKKKIVIGGFEAYQYGIN